MKPGLRDAILEHSEADNLRDAVAEWWWTSTWFLEEDEEQECPCDKNIREICEITNRVTGKRLEIGNKCIELFGCDGAREAAQVWDALRRLSRQATGSPGKALIQYGLDTGVLSPDEVDFMLGLHGRRKSLIDEMDEATRIDLNRKLLDEFAPAGLTGQALDDIAADEHRQVVSLAPTLDLADQSERDFRTAAQIATASREHAAQFEQELMLYPGWAALKVNLDGAEKVHRCKFGTRGSWPAGAHRHGCARASSPTAKSCAASTSRPARCVVRISARTGRASSSARTSS